MAHFAKLGINGKIISVLTLNNSDMLNGDGVEDESVGQQYLERHNNWPAPLWIQTSYNTHGGKHYDNKTGELSTDPSKALRGNYASIGFEWDEDNQIFWPPKPYPSFVKNTERASWDSPLGDPPDLTAEQAEVKSYYEWNEPNQSWDLITRP
tara:strand:+ start:298 stop:753 length:456 start_codon:yes stop_codon:yes gene_type:complete